MKYHEPVMLHECIEGLGIKPEGVYVDVTFGGGGHSKAILEKLGEKGVLIAFDQDPDAVANAIHDPRFVLVKDNFRNMFSQLKSQNLIPVNGILADLGVSSHQFDEAARGFSIRFEHNLDMRMNSNEGQTALKILNSYSEKELVRIFSAYGEVKNSKQLAAAIVHQRNINQFQNSVDLLNTIGRLVPKSNENQYLAQVYQALRIEVNDEMMALRELLEQSAACLNSTGRLVVMSYHSLEDRLVKNYISKGNFEGEIHHDLFGNVIGLKFNSITKKPIVPSEQEVKNNPRSRSAKLRIAEKI